jgi:hypothetical protein
MKEWLVGNPKGSKDAFDKYFKALSQDDKKVCGFLFSLLLHTNLIILSTQKYKAIAVEAVCASITCMHT